MWQSLQVTDIQHNYVSFCAGEEERCVNLEATMGHDGMWECVCVWVYAWCVSLVNMLAIIQQVSGRYKTNESSLTDF